MDKNKKYVDGFLIALPKKNLTAYKRISQKAGKVWMDYGALEYIECVGDELTTKMGLTFPKLMKLKEDETAVFSWIVYKSKAHRNSVNAKVMKDPRMSEMGDIKDMPFEMKRLSFGGFKIIVNY